MDSIVIYGIGLLMAIFTILILVNKIKISGKISGPIIVYSLLTLLPLILLVIAFIFALTIIFLILGEKITWWAFFIVSFEILLCTLVILIKLNLKPLSYSNNQDKKLINLGSGKRLIQYSIYANLLYILLLLISTVYLIIKNHETIIYILIHPIESIITVILFPFIALLLPRAIIPAAIITIVGVILISTFITFFTIIFIISMNGTIRLLYASSNIRKNALIYIILMILPTINIICMFHITRIATLELAEMK